MEETLGKRIMAHRKRLHLTQDQLADKLGVTAQAVSKWENDQSCPDINMLPKLAELFGITTDELLGHQTVYQAQVVEPEQEKDGKIEIARNESRNGAIGLGIFVVLVGGLLMADKALGWEVGFWSICWPTALLMIGVMSLLKHFGFTGVAFTLLGAYFLVNNLNIVQIGVPTELIFPTLILIFGICILVDALRKPRKRVKYSAEYKKGEKKTGFSQNGTQFDCSLSFGEEHRKVCMQTLSGGAASCSFGELELDLSGCEQITDGCCIDISCSFGEMRLLLPKYCHISDSSNAVFGGLTVEGAPDSLQGPEICLKGKVAFGELKVCYV